MINKRIFSDLTGNELRLSSVLQADQKVDFQHFSAKYVVFGNENYTLNGKKFELKQGEYVIGNTQTSSSVFIDNSQEVKGICIDISKELLTEIIDFNYEDSNQFSNYLFEHEGLIHKYNHRNSLLGNFLSQLAVDFDQLMTENFSINKDWFYEIATCIVKDQGTVYQNLNKLQYVKQETNDRLLNFVYDAKNFIDEHFLEKINLQLLAQEAKLSEYHFIRLFKAVFHITPYKYIVQNRLNYSIELLKSQLSISEISEHLGYSDHPAFTNAFKQQFGYSPNKFKDRSRKIDGEKLFI